MTSSASSPVRLAIAGYVAGRVKPERLVAQVAAAYYDGGKAGEGRRGNREELRPLIDVIERAAPGVVELAGRPGGPGFEIRLAERSFPKRYEAELRRAAETYLLRERAGEEAGEGGREKGVLLSRVLGVIRRLFSASA